MKIIFIITAITVTALTACNSNTESHETHNMAGQGNMMDSGMQRMDTSSNSRDNAGRVNDNTMNMLLSSYFKLKNALANDDAKAAASAGTEVATATTQLNVSGFNKAQRDIYDDVQEDVIEHAEHIASNGKKIAHQREHFEILSKDLYDLLKVTPTSQTIYYTNCPMYNKNKGANWLSEVKDIKNPYLGKKMLDCGTVVEELK